MLTATREATVSELNAVPQVETLPTDHEIAARVSDIRSQWTVSERVQRRQEAERRFADLLDKLASAA